MKAKDGKREEWVEWNPPLLPTWAVPATDPTVGQAATPRATTPASRPVTAETVTAETDPGEIALIKLHGFAAFAGRPLGQLPVDVLQEIHDSYADAKPNLATKIQAVLDAKRAATPASLPF